MPNERRVTRALTVCKQFHITAPSATAFDLDWNDSCRQRRRRYEQKGTSISRAILNESKITCGRIERLCELLLKIATLTKASHQ